MKRLHIDKLTSIGAVEAGDNPESKIMFWKRKQPDELTTTEPVQGLIEKEGDSMSFDVESLSDEAKAYVSELEAKLAAASEVEEVSDALPEDLPDIVAKRLDDQTADIEKQRVEKEALQKEVADLKDGIATEKYDAEAEVYEDMLGPDMGPVLKSIASESPDAYKTLTERLSVLKNLGDLELVLKEYGDSSADGSAIDQIAAHAVEIKKAQPDLTMAQAKAQAWRDHPELKLVSREETS